MNYDTFYETCPGVSGRERFRFSFVIVFRKLGPPQLFHQTHETLQVRNYETNIIKEKTKCYYLLFR